MFSNMTNEYPVETRVASFLCVHRESQGWFDGLGGMRPSRTLYARSHSGKPRKIVEKLVNLVRRHRQIAAANGDPFIKQIIGVTFFLSGIG